MKKTLHRGATLGIGIVNGMLVIAHGKATPSREDWDMVCQTIAEQHKTARGQLVLSLGGVPNAAQRKAALDQLPAGFVAPPVAAMSDDRMILVIVTALNWFTNDSHRIFRISDVAGAAKHLRIGEAQARELVTFAHELAPKT